MYKIIQYPFENNRTFCDSRTKLNESISKMVSLFPEEIPILLEWGKNELIKLLKSQQAYNVFQTEIETGKLNVQLLSRKLTLKLGTKNGQFINKLQKFIKNLKQKGPSFLNEEPEISQTLKNEKDKSIQNESNNEKQENQTIIQIPSNIPGTKSISRTVLTSDDNQQKTVSITISFEETRKPEKQQNENLNKEEETLHENKDELSEIDSENSDNLEPNFQTPHQQFLEIQKKVLYAREEARFKIHEQRKTHLPKISLQPRLWSVYTLEQESEHNEEEENDVSYLPMIETTNLSSKSLENTTPMEQQSSSSYSSSSSSDSDSDSDDKSRHRRHHKRRKHSRH